LCNQTFYEGNLRIRTNLNYSAYPNDLPIGVHWIDCKGEAIKHPAGSRYNLIEAEVVISIFRDVLNKIQNTPLSIGVVTPYSRQAELIVNKIQKFCSSDVLQQHKVEVLTTHKFQGTERDIIIFSLVLASKGDGNSCRWYNIYPQILNVALSRAKYLLYIVGDKEYCLHHTCFKGEECILKRLVKAYNNIKRVEKLEKYTVLGKFDSPTERYLFEKLNEVNFEKWGYKLIPKLVYKRYTLDFALIGKKKINIECDGYQHELIEGLPVLEDVERDDFLNNEGWQVLRFPNHRILSDVEGVIKEILKSL